MKTTTERFLSKYKRNEETGCLEWTAGTNKDGYGIIYGEGKSFLAHRLSFELFVGPIPEGMKVCHSCDSPCCVNPEHLFIGTQKDNMDDKVRKNRQSKLKGSRNGHSKLSERDVQLISQIMNTRNKYGMSTFLSRWFGVSHTQIARIANGETWSHLNSISQSLTV